MTDTILKYPDIERITGLTRRTICDMVGKGVFPRPFRINPAGGQQNGWRSSDVQKFIDERAESVEAA